MVLSKRTELVIVFSLLICLLNSMSLIGTNWQDSEYFILWDFSETKHEVHSAAIMALIDLKFCRFPSESYVFNNYPEVKKQPVASIDLQKMLEHAEQLSIFCIAGHGRGPELVCGVEISHLTRINCAYVFKNLPDIENLKVYLVSKAVVGECIAMEDIDNMIDNYTTDWSSLAQDLNSDTELPKPAERYAVTIWLIKVKNYFMQKAVNLLLYFVE